MSANYGYFQAFREGFRNMATQHCRSISAHTSSMNDKFTAIIQLLISKYDLIPVFLKLSRVSSQAGYFIRDIKNSFLNCFGKAATAFAYTERDAGFVTQSKPGYGGIQLIVTFYQAGSLVFTIHFEERFADDEMQVQRVSDDFILDQGLHKGMNPFIFAIEIAEGGSIGPDAQRGVGIPFIICFMSGC